VSYLRLVILAFFELLIPPAPPYIDPPEKIPDDERDFEKIT
jgi:hypothetical protein